MSCIFVPILIPLCTGGDLLGFWRGTFVMTSWVGIFSQSFFFLATLMRFGGLGFYFFILKVSFPFCEHL
jgi:hypothetical protein